MNTVSNIDNLLVSLGQTAMPMQTNKSTDAKMAGVSFLDVLQNFAATLTTQAPVVAPTAEVTDMPAWLSALLTVVGPNTLVTQTPDPITGEALAETPKGVPASLTNIMAAVQTVVVQNSELTSPAAQTSAEATAQITAAPVDDTPTDQNIINLVNTITALSGAFQMPAPVVEATTPEVANNVASSAQVSAVTASATGEKASVASMNNVPAGQNQWNDPANVVVSPAVKPAVNGDKTVAANPGTSQSVPQTPETPVATAYVATQPTTPADKPSIAAPAVDLSQPTLKTTNGQPAPAKATNAFTQAAVAQTNAANAVPTAGTPSTNAPVTAPAMNMPAVPANNGTVTPAMAFSTAAPATDVTTTTPASNAAPVINGSARITITGNKAAEASLNAASTFARTLENQPVVSNTAAPTGATVSSAGEEKAVTFTQKNNPATSTGSTAEAKVEFAVPAAQDNSAPAVNPTTPKTVDAPQQTAPMPELPVLKQISESAKIFRQQGATSVRMHLQPEELGQVLVQLKVVNGEVSVHVLAESTKAQSLIQDNLAQLKTAFNNQGLNTQHLEVALGSDASAFNQSRQQSGSWNRQNGSAKQSSSAAFPSINAVDAPSRNRVEGLSGRVDYQI